MDDNTNKIKYINLVKSKIYFVMKEDLIDYALNNKFISNKNITKDAAIKVIIDNLNEDRAYNIIHIFNEYIGYTAVEIENLLKITKSERVKWTKKKLLNVTGSYEVRAYGTYLDCPIYDGLQIIDLMEKGVEEIRNSVKPPTEKQLAAIEIARKKSIESRTCKKCGDVVKTKNRLNSEGLCKWCSEKEYMDRCSKQALDRRKYWLEHKNQYVILDFETTGLYYNDEIVDIGIIDLDGNVLMDQLVRPTQKIPYDATAIHGITDDMVKNCPTWKVAYLKVKKILKDKTVIAYNASFDIDMIKNSCSKYNIEAECVKYECLMENTMEVWGTERWISLQKAIDAEDIHIVQDHRAISDCKLCLELIKKNN